MRTNHGQVNIFLLGKIDQRLYVGDGDILEAGFQRGAGIAGRYIDLLDPGVGGQPPGDCVFAAATADDEEFHLIISAGSGERR